MKRISTTSVKAGDLITVRHSDAPVRVVKVSLAQGRSPRWAVTLEDGITVWHSMGGTTIRH